MEGFYVTEGFHKQGKKVAATSGDKRKVLQMLDWRDKIKCSKSQG